MNKLSNELHLGFEDLEDLDAPDFDDFKRGCVLGVIVGTVCVTGVVIT